MVLPIFLRNLIKGLILKGIRLASFFSIILRHLCGVQEDFELFMASVKKVPLNF